MGNQSQTFSINWTLPCLLWGAIPQHLHGHRMGTQDHSIILPGMIMCCLKRAENSC